MDRVRGVLENAASSMQTVFPLDVCNEWKWRDPLMFWKVFTTRCSALGSVTVRFPYHTVTLLVRILYHTAVKVHKNSCGKVLFLQCPQEGEASASLPDPAGGFGGPGQVL